MILADLPPAMQERVVCSVAAAVRYNVPANIVLGIAELEGGRPDTVSRNKNGTADIGVMQFNTGYLAGLEKYGISPKDVAGAGCYPYELATWRVAGHIQNDSGDLWTRAANYHSRTAVYNQAYRAKLIKSAAKWGEWLTLRMNTVEVGLR